MSTHRPVPSSRCALRLAACLFLLVGVAPLTGAAPAVPTDTDERAAIKQAVSELIRKEMKAKDVTGLSIALVEDQKIVWAEGFGYADRARRLPARAETLYSTGGLSMLFTSAALLQFADQGTIDLDQPVKKYLPEFSIRTRFAQAPAITPRHLLAHLSGLPAMHFKGMWMPKPEPLAAFVARLKDEYVANPPGYVFSPSFPGYDVVGRVVEASCSQAFAACLQERLLAPLGMQRSTFNVERADRALLATHYWSEKPVASLAVRDVPAAGLVSSVAELAQFLQMLFADGKLDGKQILKPRSVQEMLRVQNAGVALDLDTRVGLGWRLSGVRFPQARTVAWLNNESPFARGRMLIVPEHKLGVIVLTNSSGSSEAVEKVSERLAELVLQKRKPLPPAEPRLAATTASAPQKREDIVGHYATALGLISVKADADRYRAQMLGKTLDLNMQPEGLLAPEYRFLGLIPIPISVLKEARLTSTRLGGQHVAVAYYRNQAHRLGTRIEPVHLPAAWRKRLGEYQVVERDPLLDLMKLGNVALAHSDGLLYFRYRVPGWLGLVAKIAVRPVSDTELVISGTGWLMGETVQVVQRDGRETLRYSGYEFRRIGTAQNP
jgi:CubicO group peptidase (beta-lactamase class C family)